MLRPIAVRGCRSTKHTLNMIDHVLCTMSSCTLCAKAFKKLWVYVYTVKGNRFETPPRKPERNANGFTQDNCVALAARREMYVGLHMAVKPVSAVSRARGGSCLCHHRQPQPSHASGLGDSGEDFRKDVIPQTGSFKNHSGYHRVCLRSDLVLFLWYLTREFPIPNGCMLLMSQDKIYVCGCKDRRNISRRRHHFIYCAIIIDNVLNLHK